MGWRSCTGTGWSCISHGVPPHQRPAPVRLRDDQRPARPGPAGRRRRHRPRLRQPRHPVAPHRRREARRGSGHPRNHRYSASRGIPNLRKAICSLYQRRFGVELDPEREAITTIGAKEGFSHLMWVLLGPGDAALVPSPWYPIHIFGPALAGADVRAGPDDGPRATTSSTTSTRPTSGAAPPPGARRVVPAQPHDGRGRPGLHAAGRRLLPGARAGRRARLRLRETYFDGYVPPSILEAQGAKDSRSSSTPSRSRSRWPGGASASSSATPRSCRRSPELKSYLDYGTFQPIQIASIVAMNEAPDYPLEVNEIYRSRRDALFDGLHRIGWDVPKPQGTMFAWARIPEPYREIGSLEFATMARRRPRSPSAPGWASAPAARATCASPSSRTSSASARPSPGSGGRCPS